MSNIRHIPLAEPKLSGREWTYVKQCLDTGWVSSVGTFVDRFEHDVARIVGTRHAVATINCTAALHIALHVAGVQPDDEVLVSTLTFVASANSVRHANAWPVFVDAEPNHWQMDPSLVEEFLKNRCVYSNGACHNRRTGRRVRAIMPVHILGHPVDWDAIAELSHRYGLRMIEDAAEGLGSRYKDRNVGSLGDVACFSFNGNKTITTGGGGMIVTNDEKLADRARYLTTQAKDHSHEYIHGEVGYNYRLSNVLAAIGVAQLEGLREAVEAKRRIAGYYRNSLQSIDGIRVFQEASDAYCGYWLSAALVDSSRFGITSRALCRQLGAQNIGARLLWQPMHASPAHRACESILSGVADQLAQQAICLPCSVGITQHDLRRVTSAIHGACDQPSSATQGTWRRSA